MYIVTQSVLERDDHNSDYFCSLLKSVEFEDLTQAANYFDSVISSCGDLQEVDQDNNNCEVIRCFKKQVGKKEYYYQFGIGYAFEGV